MDVNLAAVVWVVLVFTGFVMAWATANVLSDEFQAWRKRRRA
jgi:hypothetical protein